MFVRSVMELMKRTRSTSPRRVGSRRLRVILAVVGACLLTSSAAGALFSTTLSQFNTFVAGAITPATDFSAHSVTATSAQLVWNAPLSYTPTNWTITQSAPSGAVSGTCAAAEPTSGCSVTGLTSGVTYTWTITYFDGGWRALAATSATPSLVTSGAHGTYTLSVPAHVGSFTFTMSGAGGGGGDPTGNAGSNGDSVTGVVTFPRTNSATLFTVIVGGGGGPGDLVNGGTAGAGGVGCASGAAGVADGTDDGGGGGGGAMTCIYLQGSPSAEVVQISGGTGGTGGGSGEANTGGSGGGPNYTSGTATYVVTVTSLVLGGGSSGGGPGVTGAPGSVTFGGNGLTLY
jgi:hypothetical protein